jgi:hypothetical protein
MGRPLSPPKPLPDVERLKDLFCYDAQEGILRWRDRPAYTFADLSLERADAASTQWASRFAGKPAGSRRGKEYVMVYFDKFHHMAHRVIWKMVYGEDPLYIDHIDGDKGNNRIENLRNVSHSVNMKNKSLYKSNKTGVPGVEYHERDKIWRAKIGVGGGQVQLGSYATKDEAVAARIAGQIMLDYHENHGRPKGS